MGVIRNLWYFLARMMVGFFLVLVMPSYVVVAFTAPITLGLALGVDFMFLVAGYAIFSFIWITKDTK